jgi:hypothetical protein
MPPHHLTADPTELSHLAHTLAHAAETTTAIALDLQHRLITPHALLTLAEPTHLTHELSTALDLADAIDGPHGLLTTAAALAEDALRVETCKARYEATESSTLRGLCELGRDLAHGRIRATQRDIDALPQHVTTDLAPHLGTISEGLALLTHNTTYTHEERGDQPITVTPLPGLALPTLVHHWDPRALRGHGDVRPVVAHDVATHLHGTRQHPIGDIGALFADIGTLGRAGHGEIAVRTIAVGPDDIRYVVELPGIASLGASPYPQNLPTAIAAEFSRRTSYSRDVLLALHHAGAPPDARVLLVGHSEGGMVALDLASDPAVDGAAGGYHITDVLTAGTPLGGGFDHTLARTNVFTLDNRNDLVVHLAGHDHDPRPSPHRLTYEFSDNRGTIAGDHRVALYQHWAERLSRSPTLGASLPWLRRLRPALAPYLSSPVIATQVFSVGG